MRLLCHLFYRAPKIDVDHADVVIMCQAAPDLCESFRLIVPDLDGQGPRLLADPPQPVRVHCLLLVQPNKAFRVNHFCRVQTDAAVASHDLAERVIREPRHWRLQNGGINQQIANF